MAYWRIEFKSRAEKQLNKLGKHSQQEIQHYLNEVILKLDHPTQLGKPLRKKLKGLWRYRVDKLRIICKIHEDKLIVLVLKIARRDIIYDE